MRDEAESAVPRGAPKTTLAEAAYTTIGVAIGAVTALAATLPGRVDLRERMGLGAPPSAGVRPLWFHGASVGELSTLRPIVREVRDHFGEKVLRSVIPRTVRLSEAPSFGQPITTFDPRSRGAIAYRDAAKEVHRDAS